jgi:hypothetical protein
MYWLYIALCRPILLMYMMVALIDMFVIKLFSYNLNTILSFYRHQRLLEKSSCSLINRIFNDEMNDL